MNTNNKQIFDYFCVLDFEATCQESNKDYTMEIIEFPSVMINTNTLQIEGTFQMYVKPIVNPILSNYCTNLTGITQEQVDDADDFSEVLKQFTTWISTYGSNILFITCGDWDLKTMLPNQCGISNLSKLGLFIEMPEMFSSWCNIKKMYNRYYSEKVRGIRAMKEINSGTYFNVGKENHQQNHYYRVQGMKSLLNRLGLPLIGRKHSGIDDSRNIAAATVKMCQDGCVFEYTQPKRDIGDELIEGLRAILRGEGKRTEIKLEETGTDDAN